MYCSYSRIDFRLFVQICITFCLENCTEVTVFSPDSRVFTPKDGDNWMIAKLNLQLTDLGYSQMVEHLAKVSTFVSSMHLFHGRVYKNSNILKEEDLWAACSIN